MGLCGSADSRNVDDVSPTVQTDAALADYEQKSALPIVYDEQKALQVFKSFVEKFKIPLANAAQMRSLADFKIAFLADDSGSMEEPAYDREYAESRHAKIPTRWEELKEMVRLVFDLAGILTKNPMDVYFMNRPGRLNVRQYGEVEDLFRSGPGGGTPTCTSIENIVRAEEPRLRSEQQLLIFIATDGHASDGDMDACLARVMGEHKELHVTFVACMSEERLLAHMEGWGRKYDRIGVVDELRVETKQMKKRHRKDPGFTFTVSDYLTKALLVSVNKDIKELFRDDWGGDDS